MSRGKNEAPAEGGAIALFEQNTVEVRKLVGRAKAQIDKLIGPAMSERFLRAAVAHYIHADRPEDMLSVDPRNYIAAVMDAATDRLVPDGRDGWIIPYKRDCDWRVSWRGLLKVARRATTLRDVSAEVVYAADRFHIDLGSNRKIEHTPYYALGIPANERGAMLGVYAGMRVAPTWSYEFRFIDYARLEQIAEMSGNPHNKVWSPVWEKHFAQQSMKHAFRKLCDWIEVPDDVLDVMAREDERSSARAKVVQDDPVGERPTKMPSLADEVRAAGGEPKEIGS